MQLIDHDVLKRRVVIYAEQMAEQLAESARKQGVNAWTDGPTVLIGPEDARREYEGAPWVAGVIGRIDGGS